LRSISIAIFSSIALRISSSFACFALRIASSLSNFSCSFLAFFSSVGVRLMAAGVTDDFPSSLNSVICF